MLFSILIGLAERFFAAELMKYMEDYHARQHAQAVANAPQTLKEELDYWDKHD